MNTCEIIKGRFYKGHIPWHKGKKTGLIPKSAFKKGSIPWNKTDTNVKCCFCGITFHKKPHCVRKNNFCSQGCYGEWLKNDELNQIRIRELGKKSIGREVPIEQRIKLSILFTGKNHPQWKGGTTPINKRIRGTYLYKEWREKVFRRDNWTCKMCNKKGGFLHPHHIKSFAKFPELRFKISNGITLHKNCHLLLHKLLKNTFKIMEVKKCGVQNTRPMTNF